MHRAACGNGGIVSVFSCCSDTMLSVISCFGGAIASCMRGCSQRRVSEMWVRCCSGARLSELLPRVKRRCNTLKHPVTLCLDSQKIC